MIVMGLEGTAHTAGVGIVDTSKGVDAVIVNLTDTYIPKKGGIHPREAANHHSDVFPGLVKKEDIIRISECLKGSKKYFLQQFRPLNTYDKKYLDVEPCTIIELKEMRDAVNKCLGSEICKLRNI